MRRRLPAEGDEMRSFAVSMALYGVMLLALLAAIVAVEISRIAHRAEAPVGLKWHLRAGDAP